MVVFLDSAVRWSGQGRGSGGCCRRGTGSLGEGHKSRRGHGGGGGGVIDGRGGNRRRGTGGGTTRPDRRAGKIVGSWDRVVDVEVDVGILRLVHTGDLDQGARNARSRTGNLDLSAGEVELGIATEAAMKANVLNTDKILTGRSILGDLEGRSVLTPSAPVGILQAIGNVFADTLLVYLEPIPRSVVGLDIAGCLGHVDLQRPRVLHRSTIGELKTDLCTRSDGIDLCLGRRVHGTFVAAEVVVHDFRSQCWLVPIAILADVFEILGCLSVDNQLRKHIMTRNQRGDTREKGKRGKVELHLGQKTNKK